VAYDLLQLALSRERLDPPIDLHGTVPAADSKSPLQGGHHAKLGPDASRERPVGLPGLALDKGDAQRLDEEAREHEGLAGPAEDRGGSGPIELADLAVPGPVGDENEERQRARRPAFCQGLHRESRRDLSRSLHQEKREGLGSEPGEKARVPGLDPEADAKVAERLLDRGEATALPDEDQLRTLGARRVVLPAGPRPPGTSRGSFRGGSGDRRSGRGSAPDGGPG
jgi:hypothetical protein